MDAEFIQAEIESLEAERAELSRSIEALRRQLELAPSEEKAKHAAELRSLMSRRSFLRRALDITVLLAVGFGLAWWLMHDRVTPLELDGKVTVASEGAPVTTGSECRVRVEALSGSDNAHITLSCGKARLYGSDTSFGALRCDPPTGPGLLCEDSDSIAADGDPSLRLDRARGTIQLADWPRWSLEIELEPG